MSTTTRNRALDDLNDDSLWPGMDRAERVAAQLEYLEEGFGAIAANDGHYTPEEITAARLALYAEQDNPTAVHGASATVGRWSVSVSIHGAECGRLGFSEVFSTAVTRSPEGYTVGKVWSNGLATVTVPLAVRKKADALAAKLTVD